VNLQLLCIGLFYAMMVVAGLWAARSERRTATFEGMLLADRRLPLWVGAFTMTATWVGGAYINGTAEAVYAPHSGLVWAQAPWCYALSLILGGTVFAVRMRRTGATTLLDPFQQRYGQRVTALLGIPALIGEVFWAAAILTALGTTFGTLLNVNFETSILISAGVALLYTVIGGLWSVSYTDVLQLSLIAIGLGIAIPSGLESAGGGQRLWDAYASQMPGFPRGVAIWKWLDMALLLIFGGIPWQVYFQRVLASRDDRTAVRLSFIAGIGCLLLACPAVILGAVGAVATWPAGVAAPQPELVLPEVLQHLTNPAVATIGLAAVTAAVMSSVDSSFLSAASLLTQNVYRPLFRPQAADSELRTVLRGNVLIVGGLATWLALATQSVYELWYLCSDLVYVLLFPQLTLLLFCRWTTPCGAICGVLVGLFLRLGGGEPTLGLPAFLDYPLQTPDGCLFPFRTVAMLSSLATIAAVSWLDNARRRS